MTPQPGAAARRAPVPALRAVRRETRAAVRQQPGEPRVAAPAPVLRRDAGRAAAAEGRGRHVSERLTEDILGAMAVALRHRDFGGVIALWKMLAIQDPDKAAELLAIVQEAPEAAMPPA